VRVRDRVQRARRRVRRDQPAHRSRHGRHARHRNSPAVQRPLPARPARPVVQRPVRRGHVPDHVEPDACPDVHAEQLRVRVRERRPIRLVVRNVLAGLRPVHVAVALVAVLVGMSPRPPSRRPGKTRF